MGNEKTKEQIDKDFEQILAMSQNGQISISTSEFSHMVNEIEKQFEAIQRVRELHKPLTQGAGYMGSYCAVCHEGNT